MHVLASTFFSIVEEWVLIPVKVLQHFLEFRSPVVEPLQQMLELLQLFFWSCKVARVDGAAALLHARRLRGWRPHMQSTIVGIVTRRLFDSALS